MTNRYYLFLHVKLILFVFLSVVSLTSCRIKDQSNYNNKIYDVIIANSSYVTINDLSINISKTIFSLPSDSDYIITSASLDSNNDRIAISLVKNNAMPNNALIVFISNKPPYSVVEKLQTDIDRIWGLSCSNKGDIVFVSGNAKLDYPNNICVVMHMSKTVEVVLSGKYYFNPSWDFKSKSIYLTSLKDDERVVGYVSIDSPGVFREISKGVSISASSKDESSFYLSFDASIFAVKNGVVGEKINISKNYLDPRFADAICFVRFGDELIVQQYMKATSYRLLIIPPPYNAIYPFLSSQPMQSFEVIKKTY